MCSHPFLLLFFLHSNCIVSFEYLFTCFLSLSFFFLLEMLTEKKKR